MLLYVADTYNNKIKLVNPLTMESKTYSGTGIAGNRDGGEEAQFYEPSGLTIMNGKIYVTDINNHLLRVIDLNTKQVKTVRITNPDKLSSTMYGKGTNKNNEVIRLEPVNLPQGEVKIRFDFRMPEGYHINPEALPQLAVDSAEGLVQEKQSEINTSTGMFEFPVDMASKKCTLNIEALIYYCETENEGVCKYKDVYFEVSVSIDNGAKNIVNIYHELK